MKMTPLKAVGGLIVACGLLVSGAATAHEGTDRPVKATSDAEISVAKDNGYLAWVRFGPRSKHINVFVQTPNGKRLQVNPKGTDAQLGAISGKHLIYSEYLRREDGSPYHFRIRIHNLKTHKTRTPSKLNSPGRFEYFPGLSGNRAMFGEEDRRAGKRRLVIVNMKTGKRNVIASVPIRDYIQPGQIRGKFTAWIQWRNKTRPGSKSRLYVHEKGVGSRGVGPGTSYMWSPSVSRDGTAYAVLAATKGCGHNTRWARFEHGKYSKPHVLFDIRDGYDSTRSYATFENHRTVVYHERSRCKHLTTGSDIFKIKDIHS
jgi:hypothetical protein